MLTGNRALDGIVFIAMTVGSKMMWNKYALGTWW